MSTVPDYNLYFLRCTHLYKDIVTYRDPAPHPQPSETQEDISRSDLEDDHVPRTVNCTIFDVKPV